MNPEISIIVPVYKVEQYLHKCIESILNQTFEDFELILLNDGSPDKCGEICNNYAQLDTRIKVIHKKNEGLCKTRNKGITLSRGKYIMFIDSDDYVEPNMCEELIKAIEQNPNSLVICSIKIHNSKESSETIITKVSYKGESNCIKVKKNNFFTIYEKNLLNYSWNKIFSSKIIKENNIKFNEDIQLAEDLLFNLEYLKYSNEEIVIINKHLYNYFLRDRESLVSKYYENLFDICKYTFDELYNCMVLFGTDIEEKKASYYNSYLHYLHSVLDNTFRENSNLKFINKFKYNNMVLNSKEFKLTLEYANLKGFHPIYLIVLKTKNYLLIHLFKKMLLIRNQSLRK